MCVRACMYVSCHHSQTNMDFDEVLNLEEQFYQEGYQEGREANLRDNYLEGKQYGLQVGFQRYALLGQIRGICEVLESRTTDAALQKNVDAVKRIIDSVPTDNDDTNVAAYERSMVRLRNKFRLVLTLLRKQSQDARRSKTDALTFEKVEQVSRIVAGELQGYVEDADTGASDLAVRTQAQLW